MLIVCYILQIFSPRLDINLLKHSKLPLTSPVIGGISGEMNCTGATMAMLRALIKVERWHNEPGAVAEVQKITCAPENI